MKETKCDCCGKVIGGYYPNHEIKRGGTRYNFSCTVPGQIKQGVSWKLSVDCKWDWDPIEYHFCSVDCLKKYADVIDNAIEHAEENYTGERPWKHDKK